MQHSLILNNDVSGFSKWLALIYSKDTQIEINNKQMKNLFLIIALVFPGILSAQEAAPFVLKGKIGNVNAPLMIHLTYNGDDGKQKNDSTQLKNGVFELRGNISGVREAWLTLDHRKPNKKSAEGYKLIDAVQLYIDKGIIEAYTNEDSLNNVTLKGSINPLLQKYERLKIPYDRQFDQFRNEGYKLTAEQVKDTVFMGKRRDKFNLFYKQQVDFEKKFIAEHPDSYLSLQIAKITVQSKFTDIKDMDTIYKSLSENLKNTKLGKAIGKLVVAAQATVTGGVAPEFVIALNDTSGKPVKLADFRGKYVLIDFWASWCVPCRRESPNVIKAYEAYKDRGFTVLGISGDENKDSWLKATKQDKLPWTNVIDVDDKVNWQYGITSIPASLLLDKEGRIIAKNLRGEALQQKLAELLSDKK